MLQLKDMKTRLNRCMPESPEELQSADLNKVRLLAEHNWVSMQAGGRISRNIMKKKSSIFHPTETLQAERFFFLKIFSNDLTYCSAFDM